MQQTIMVMVMFAVYNKISLKKCVPDKDEKKIEQYGTLVYLLYTTIIYQQSNHIKSGHH